MSIFYLLFSREPVYKYPRSRRYYVYLIECSDGSIYTGSTKNLLRRIEQHKTGIGAIYTKLHGVRRVIHVESFATKREAYKREWEIKFWDKKSKLALANGHLVNPVLSKYARKYIPKVNPWIKPQNLMSDFSREALLKILMA